MKKVGSRRSNSRDDMHDDPTTRELSSVGSPRSPSVRSGCFPFSIHCDVDHPEHGSMIPNTQSLSINT